MPTYLEPLEVPGNSRSPANSALGLGSSVPLRNPYYYSKFDYSSYGKITTGDPPKRTKPVARQRIERVVHEKAPQLATLVAGHGDGGLKQAAKDVKDRAVSNITAGKNKSKNKRYSSSEKQHLVEDESGELHDPEYESFRMVQNPSTHHSRTSRSNGGESDDGYSVSETSEETEDEAVASVRMKQAELMNGKTSLNRPPLPTSSRSGIGAGQPSRSYRGSSLHTPISASHRTSNAHPSGSAFGNILAGSLAGSRRGTPSIRSKASDGSDRPEKRTGGVTYLAPSIAMPPVASSYASSTTIQPQAYNPVSRGLEPAYEHVLTNVDSIHTCRRLPQRHKHILTLLIYLSSAIIRHGGRSHSLQVHWRRDRMDNLRLLPSIQLARGLQVLQSRTLPSPAWHLP